MWLTAVVLSLGASVVLHALLVRLRPEANRPVSFLAVGIVVGFSALVVVARRYGWVSFELAAFAMTYAFCCELYLFLFSSALTSISMNLLVRLLQRAMSDREIAQLYDSNRMVARRIERLLATSLLSTGKAGRYEITSRGERLVRLLQRLARFFRNTSPGKTPS